MSYKVIDLFSGVGGLSKGFADAGFDIVAANEIDPSIATAYKKNHPNTKMINQDITNLDILDTFGAWKNIMAIVGGPPCQGFSQKGKRNILNDPRNYLFKYFFSVVKMIEPQYFLIENVPNILTADNGVFRDEIYEIFQGIGYTLTSSILNSADFGVPQFRRRAIILGKKGEESISLPLGSSKTVTSWEAISDLAYLNSGEGTEISEYMKAPENKYQRKMRKYSTTLFNHKATNHSSLVLERMRYIPVNGNRSHLPKEHLTKSIYSGTWGRIVKEEPSVTITTRFDTPSSGRFTHPYLDRAITVREAARLQSFPDDFVFYGNKMSQMKQVGNAVPPLLAEAIAKVIRKDIEEKNE